MWPSTPTPKMETATTQETCSVPWRTNWGARGSPFLLPWIATMGHNHQRQISWGATYHRSDHRRNRVHIHANHTPFFSKPSSSFPSWHTGWEITLWGPGRYAPFPNKGSTQPRGDGLAIMYTCSHLPPDIPGNATPRDSSYKLAIHHPQPPPPNH